MFQSKNSDEDKIPAEIRGDFFTEEISIPEAKQKIIDHSYELNNIHFVSRRRRAFLIAEIQRLQKLVNIHEDKQTEMGADFKPPGFW